MNETDASIEWLYSLGKFGIKLGLENTRALMRMSENPHEGAKGVHIAGTNGKGSVAAMLSSILKKAGYRVGTYTSPHLLNFGERMTIDGRPIPEEKLLELIETFEGNVKKLNKEGIYPTFFEVLTAMAFTYFRDEGANIWVIETGMGGRLDSTNISKFKTGIITSIGMDHTSHLGDSIEKIAREKAGIIKKNMRVISAAEGNILRIIDDFAAKKEAGVFSWNRDFQADAASIDVRGMDVYIDSISDEYHARISLTGKHQLQNAALAVAAAETLRHDDVFIEKSAILSGLEDARWPGRFELVNYEPPVILDAAHNLPGAAALAETLKDTGLWGKCVLVLGVLKDKDADGIASVLVPGAKDVIITQPEYEERALKMEELMKITEKYGPVKGMRNPAEAVEYAMSLGSCVLITGSIYLLGDVLSSVKFNK